MLERLEKIAARHAAVVDEQADPAVAVDPKRSREIAIKIAEVADDAEEVERLNLENGEFREEIGRLKQAAQEIRGREQALQFQPQRCIRAEKKEIHRVSARSR